MNVLLWFKRDLRVADNAALALAAGMGRVLPLYIVEPELWRQPDTSARQWSFIAETLVGLREDLARMHAYLAVRTGEATDVLAKLCEQHHVTHIFSHEETGNLWTYRRDRSVAAWARSAGVSWVEVPQSGVVRALQSRASWPSRRNAFVAEPVVAAPERISVVADVEAGPIPTSRSLRLAEDRCPHRQIGGRDHASQLLDSFLAQRGEPYRRAMSSPLSAERGCSRLSPHLAVGALSIREVVQATQARQAMRPGGRWAGALSSFQSRLAWRDHFIQKLEDQPDIESLCLQRAAETLRSPMPDRSRLCAWQRGETGFPFLDACLRYLNATGWLNFRMRAMVMAAASYTLWLDWRPTGALLAQRFTDYEPGIHWPQVQMQSGTTGINRPRLYNVVTQGREQDPAGQFTRRWVPELADIPDIYLQEPWLAPQASKVLGRRYPEPVVDLASAQRAAREALALMRAADTARAERATILGRHVSTSAAAKRSGQALRAQPRRQANSSAGASDQLSLDL